jgi:iron-sulfur cluster repair protein YtfE (RIC family)
VIAVWDAGEVPTSFLRAVHGSLRPSVGALARTAAGLSRWSARTSPQRLAAAVGTLENEILPWLAAEQQVLYPVAEQRLGGPMAVGALREAYADLRRRAESLSALVSRLHDRPPTAAELDALRAGLYGLWAILGQHLSIEESTVFSPLDAVCEPGELDDLVAEVARVAGREPCGKTEAPGRLTLGDVQP